jgi:hypothetical protein
VKRIALISIAILCCAIIGAVFVSNAHGQNKIYVGWFSDANRTVAGRGCWNGPGEYRTCDFWDPPVAGWWGTGNAWLWIYAGEPGIQGFAVMPSFTPEVTGVWEPCYYDQVWPNLNIISNPDPNNPPYFPLHGFPDIWRATFGECQKGWFLVAHATVWRPGGWAIDFGGTRNATLCDENHTHQEMVIFSNFQLNPVPTDQCEGSSAIATKSATWGAIKALYK